MKAEQIIQKAIEITTTGERNLNYGKPEDNFLRIATLWNAYLKIRKEGELRQDDVAIMMVLMKLARYVNSPKHEDNMVDIFGYLLCLINIVYGEEK